MLYFVFFFLWSVPTGYLLFCFRNHTNRIYSIWLCLLPVILLWLHLPLIGHRPSLSSSLPLPLTLSQTHTHTPLTCNFHSWEQWTFVSLPYTHIHTAYWWHLDRKNMANDKIKSTHCDLLLSPAFHSFQYSQLVDGRYCCTFVRVILWGKCDSIILFVCFFFCFSSISRICPIGSVRSRCVNIAPSA